MTPEKFLKKLERQRKKNDLTMKIALTKLRQEEHQTQLRNYERKEETRLQRLEKKIKLYYEWKFLPWYMKVAHWLSGTTDVYE
jgi:hypothetical protein